MLDSGSKCQVVSLNLQLSRIVGGQGNCSLGDGDEKVLDHCKAHSRWDDMFVE